jgi:hypothetical protein
MKKKPSITANRKEQIIQLTGILKDNQSVLTTKTITVGFDGFIDGIVKSIEHHATENL